MLIEAIDLSKRFAGDRLALDGLSLQVQAGELYCLLGAQGSGKTTAIGLFLAFWRPTSGQAIVAGVDPANRPVEATRHVSYIRVQASLYDTMTPRQNIEFFTRLGMDEPAPRAAVYDAMRQYGVPERSFDRKVASLPRELRLSLWLAIASLKQTPIIILDEPTSGLDSRASADLQEHLLDFKHQGKAILLATTDVFLASQVSDRIGILKQGRKVAERTRSQMLGLSLSELYFDYVGRPSQSVTEGALGRREV